MGTKYENLLEDGSGNVIQSFFDNFLKSNTEFRYKAGFTTKVIRESLGACCPWCDAKVGEWEYPGCPTEIFGRHKNCNCIVVTKTERNTYQDAWSRIHYDSYQDARIARAEELIQNIEKNKTITPEERLSKIDGVLDAVKNVRFTDRDGNVIIASRKQFGKKCGEHAIDYGIDPNTADGRLQFEHITNDILQNSDEIRIGNWRMQEGDCEFHIKGNDVVITNKGNYVSTMKGAIDNVRIKNARRRKIY